MYLAVIKYSSFVNRLLGLSNFVIEEDRKRKFVAKVLSIIIPLTSIIVALSFVATVSLEASKTTSYITKMIFILEITISGYFVIISNLRRFHFKELFEKIKECEIDLKKFMPRYQSENYTPKLKTVLLINFCVFLGIITCFFVTNDGTDIPYITYYNSTYAILVIYTVTLTFMFYGIKLHQQLEGANEIIENISQSKDQTSDILFDEATIDNLENFFSKIYFSMDTISNYFQLYFFGCLIYSTFQPLWSLYFIIVRFRKKSNSVIIAYIYWSGIQFFSINEWIWGTTSLEKQMSKLDNNFYKLARTLPNTRYYKMATSITVKLLKRNSTNTIAGVFPTDWTLNTWMTSTIISYLVIILQFRMQEYSSDTSHT